MYPCLGHAGDELLPVSARAVVENFPVASKGMVALGWLVLCLTEQLLNTAVECPVLYKPTGAMQCIAPHMTWV